MKLLVLLLVVCCACGPSTARGERTSGTGSERTNGVTAVALSSDAVGSLSDAGAGERMGLLAWEAGVPQPPFWYADLDPSNDGIVAPPEDRVDCENELVALGVKFRRASIPVHEEGKKRKILCGASQMVTYLGGPAKIRYNGPPTLTCRMALALARAEVVAQEEAQRIFGKSITRVDQLGTYNCREMAAYPGWVSEHSYANAIDLERFVLSSGKEISVLQHFQKGEGEPTTREAQFLRSFSRRLYDQNVFSNVLTPYFDSLHANHFHLDLGRYRTDGTRPQ